MEFYKSFFEGFLGPLKDNWEIIVFFVVVSIISLVVKTFLPLIKGAVGEKAVISLLEKLPRKEYRIINNVMLPKDEITTQIDHVVVSVYGIFVIETKNYEGWITGGERSQQWTQNIYGNKNKIGNPLHQNYGHIKTLQALLDLPDDAYISIVAFSSRGTLKVKTDAHVIYYSDLLKTIKGYKKKIIEEEQLDAIVEKIKNANVDSRKMRKEHVSNIRKNINNNERLVSENICPKCGGQLVQRNGKYGAFLGCSNYPKCRYIKK